MMRAGSWLMVSGGLAAGLGTAALGLAAAQGALAQAAALPALAAVAASMGLASLALLGLLGAPAASRASAAEARPTFPDAAEPRPAPHPRRAPSGPPVPGVAAPAAIGFAALPIVGVADGEPAAAVAIEPSFRDARGRTVGAEAIDWARVPARLRARLDDTLLARAAAFAELRAGEGRCCTVIVAVDAASLGERGVADRLGRLFDRAGPGSRPRLVVLARGTADDLDAYLALPRPWRDRLGLRLTAAPADEAALDRCLAAEPGCLELDASLLAGGAGRSGRAARLAARLAGAGVPVVASGVRDGALLRDLRASYPALFARGPLFGSALADAAVHDPPRDARARDAGVRRTSTSSESG